MILSAHGMVIDGAVPTAVSLYARLFGWALLHQVKGVLTVSKAGSKAPQGCLRTVTDRAFKGLPPGLYASRWTSSIVTFFLSPPR